MRRMAYFAAKSRECAGHAATRRLSRHLRSSASCSFRFGSAEKGHVRTAAPRYGRRQQAAASMTGVRLQETPTELSVVFGTPDTLQETPGSSDAFYRHGRVVAYLARHAPAQALYIFKTTEQPRASNRLRHVSRPVKLLYVASARRTATKAITAINVLRKRLGDAGIDALPDVFWLRLADFVERRGKRIAGDVTTLLERLLLS